jgi:hypothetical protein
MYIEKQFRIYTLFVLRVLWRSKNVLCIMIIFNYIVYTTKTSSTSNSVCTQKRIYGINDDDDDETHVMCNRNVYVSAHLHRSLVCQQLYVCHSLKVCICVGLCMCMNTSICANTHTHTHTWNAERPLNSLIL